MVTKTKKRPKSAKLELTPEQARVLRILNHAGEAMDMDEPPCEHCDNGRLLGQIYWDDADILKELVDLGLAKDVSEEFQVMDGAIFCITEVGEKEADARKLWF